MLNHRIRYKIIDENGQTVWGRTLVEEDVRAYAEVMRKRWRDAQYIWLELEAVIDIPEQLTPDERELLEGLD